MTSPHKKLQHIVLHLMGMCSQHSSNEESVEDFGRRMEWANETRALLGRDFFYDLNIALGESFSAKESDSSEMRSLLDNCHSALLSVEYDKYPGGASLLTELDRLLEPKEK